MSPQPENRPGGPGAGPEAWPPLPLDEWRDSYATLHMMTQVVGKVRLACAPMVNHWWQVTLHVSAHGLSTLAMPHGSRTFQMEFDFVRHVLRIAVADGEERSIVLRTRPIAEFHGEVMDTLRELGVPVRIWPRPVEIEESIPFDRDFQHTTYVPEQAHRCWRVLRQAARVLTEFRSGFVGKCSPVHFFWGSFDLAVTRFSGRRAPEHPGGVPNLADRVTREAYSRECSSCGFWPGSGAVQEPAFYAYAYPEPAGYREYPIRPAAAYYSDEMREHILPYEAVRRARDPDRMLLDFCRSTYEAAAEQGGWDRAELEHDYPVAAPAFQPPAPTFPQHDDGR
ncbi:MAG TPA: DUF5996 family protein [Gemmatimonadaceae bacterium]